MSVETQFNLFLLAFFAVLGTAVIGLVRTRPRGGQSWGWERASVFIASAVVLAAGVAYIITWYVVILTRD